MSKTVYIVDRMPAVWSLPARDDRLVQCSIQEVPVELARGLLSLAIEREGMVVANTVSGELGVRVGDLFGRGREFSVELDDVRLDADDELLIVREHEGVGSFWWVLIEVRQAGEGEEDDDE